MAKKRVVIESEDFKIGKHDSALIIKKNGSIELVFPKGKDSDKIDTLALLVTGIAMLLQSGNDTFDSLVKNQLLEMKNLMSEMEASDKKVNQ